MRKTRNLIVEATRERTIRGIREPTRLAGRYTSTICRTLQGGRGRGRTAMVLVQEPSEPAAEIELVGGGAVNYCKIWYALFWEAPQKSGGITGRVQATLCSEGLQGFRR